MIDCFLHSMDIIPSISNPLSSKTVSFLYTSLHINGAGLSLNAVKLKMLSSVHF